MPTRAFRMRLDPGRAGEYRARHDAIWPELVALLHEAGISDYSIFLDTETNHLFAIFQHGDEALLAALPAAPVMRRWWAHMADVMATNADGSPEVTPLERVFHMA